MTEETFSINRLQLVAERGACTHKPFACVNCYHFGYPCISCKLCVWNKSIQKMKPYMYTCMSNPSDDISSFRLSYNSYIQTSHVFHNMAYHQYY